MCNFSFAIMFSTFCHRLSIQLWRFCFDKRRSKSLAAELSYDPGKGLMSGQICYILAYSWNYNPTIQMGRMCKEIIVINPKDVLTLSLIQTLSNASAADSFLKTLSNNFSFCNNVFHFQSQVIHSIKEIFCFLTKYVQSRLLQNCRMRERVKCQLSVLGVNKRQYK